MWISGNSAELNENQLNTIIVRGRILLKGHTTAASIKASCLDAPTKFLPYVETSGQPTPADTGANFPTLDSNAAPSTVGVVLSCGDMDQIIKVEVPAESISSAQMTAGVIGTANLYGASNTGVTASSNGAFVISCTGLDLDSAIADHKFDVIVWYKKK